ncbi:GNAT family N-acetyltransferase [Enterococcus sp. LJL99]
MTISINPASYFEHNKLVISIAELVIYGFEAKFTHAFFTKIEVEKIAYALSECLCKSSPNNLLIAHNNGNICGCLYFTNKKTQRISIEKSLLIFLSFCKRLKLYIFLFFLEHKPKRNETYIDFLTVSPKFRGNGIGKALILQCKKMNSKNKITLYVAKENKIAINLYKKQLFQIKNKMTSRSGNYLTGITSWYFMEWIE